MPENINYSLLSGVLPSSRVSKYERVFNCNSDIETHGAYIWSIKVSGMLLPLMNALEIALRNSIHCIASEKISVDWYENLEKHTKTRKNWKTKKRDQSNIDYFISQRDSKKYKVNKAGRKNSFPKGVTIHPIFRTCFKNKFPCNFHLSSQ